MIYPPPGGSRRLQRIGFAEPLNSLAQAVIEWASWRIAEDAGRFLDRRASIPHILPCMGHKLDLGHAARQLQDPGSQFQHCHRLIGIADVEALAPHAVRMRQARLHSIAEIVDVAECPHLQSITGDSQRQPAQRPMDEQADRALSHLPGPIHVERAQIADRHPVFPEICISQLLRRQL